MKLLLIIPQLENVQLTDHGCIKKVIDTEKSDNSMPLLYIWNERKGRKGRGGKSANCPLKIVVNAIYHLKFLFLKKLV